MKINDNNYMKIYNEWKENDCWRTRANLFLWLERNENSWNGNSYTLHNGEILKPIFQKMKNDCIYYIDSEIK